LIISDLSDHFVVEFGSKTKYCSPQQEKVSLLRLKNCGRLAGEGARSERRQFATPWEA
jgi:hypothetical protein